METEVKEVIKTTTTDTAGFINTVLKFDEADKDTIMNLIQYATLAIIPSMIILKLLRFFVPEDDPSKGTVEIAGEVAIEVVFIVIALWFMNRVIKYFPTYSGKPYPETDSFTPLMPFLLVLFTIQSKLGAKLNILTERVLETCNISDKDISAEHKQSKNIVKVTQPLVPPPVIESNNYTQPLNNTQQLLPDDKTLTALPNGVSQQQSQPQPQQQTQQTPNFNDMFYNNPTPLPGAATPGIPNENMQPSEPTAANEALGSGFTSW